MSYVVLDTETTSLTGEVVQIAVVSSGGNVLFESLVKPTVPISRAASQVHGIYDNDVIGAPTFREIEGELARVIGDSAVITYNADFDKRICVNSYLASMITSGQSSLVLPGWLMRDWACAMLAYADYWGELGYYGDPKWQKLINACRQQGIDMGNVRLHSAAGDATLTARLLAAPWMVAYLGRDDRRHRSEMYRECIAGTP